MLFLAWAAASYVWLWTFRGGRIDASPLFPIGCGAPLILCYSLGEMLREYTLRGWRCPNCGELFHLHKGVIFGG